METILNLVAAAGLVGSIALLAWGMVLCLTHGLDTGGRADLRTRWLAKNLPAGTFL
jgi:hypothetical protein